MAITVQPELESSASVQDDDGSVRAALRVTMLFIVIVMLLAWAGLADAAHRNDLSGPAWRPGVNGSSPTLR